MLMSNVSMFTRIPVRCRLAGRSIRSAYSNMSLLLFHSILLVSSTATSQHWHDRYIQRTRVPTLHFQPSLPRLPIPRLEDTCSRYLDALIPVTTDEQLSKTRSIVAEFRRVGGKGEGTFLHEYV